MYLIFASVVAFIGLTTTNRSVLDGVCFYYLYPVQWMVYINTSANARDAISDVLSYLLPQSMEQFCKQ